ncbi:rhamnogalacturonan lyase [Galbibacter sp. EGI 63066]|uniref:rhamnogalacturonan lyase n=1 Tax=Galbibacter sp. EGI 63066 TaxID=2993559 RepID=UPI002248C9B2|nr:rhamnogalacturonan lyase [Galbibacter sp. EGI 63066]MCX2679813.1 rhamnogalacturonan lyase [Galbibacter sp. EGI 63066]
MIRNILAFFIVALYGFSGGAQRLMEDLDRGTVAIRKDKEEVFISWRLLGTDSENTKFNIYRGTKKLNEEPIANVTNFIDKTKEDTTYRIEAIENDRVTNSKAVKVWSKPYLEIPIQQPLGGKTPDGVEYSYTANDCSVADLDGDGQYEIILKWNPTNAKDNSHEGYTGNVFLDAYEFDGTRLWRIDLGKNIRAGAHYTQFIAYDFDGDGFAEVACKTADGTIDGEGNAIGDPKLDYRNKEGRILKGEEYLSIFEGKSGVALSTVDYIPSRHPKIKNPDARQLKEIWGDGYGNRVDRFLAGVGYFNGKKPSLIMARGYYTRSVLVAWDFKNGKLHQRWKFDSNDKGNEAYAGQGNHQLAIADVDNDGKDEVVYGAMTIDDDGTGLYSSGLGHGDAMHVGDLVPKREGLEIWTAQEDRSSYRGHGLWLRDANTGETLWGVKARGDVGRGLSANVDPRYEGNEMWGAVGGLHNASGEKISNERLPMNFAIWWDGDLLRELLDKNTIYKWNYKDEKVKKMLVAEGATSNNGTKATPALSADIIGDWREEVIFRSKDNQSLRLYSTVFYTNHCLYTLMHNPQYRLSIAWQNVAYNQPPHPDFFIGESNEQND